jgi:hypothetical protein
MGTVSVLSFAPYFELGGHRLLANMIGVLYNVAIRSLKL